MASRQPPRVRACVLNMTQLSEDFCHPDHKQTFFTVDAHERNFFLQKRRKFLGKWKMKKFLKLLKVGYCKKRNKLLHGTNLNAQCKIFLKISIKPIINEKNVLPGNPGSKVKSNVQRCITKSANKTPFYISAAVIVTT